MNFIGPWYREPCIHTEGEERTYTCPAPGCPYGTEGYMWVGEFTTYRRLLRRSVRAPTEREQEDSMWDRGRPMLIAPADGRWLWTWEKIGDGWSDSYKREILLPR